MSTYDLLIMGGEVIDPATGHRGRGDVAIIGDRIAAVGPDLSSWRGGRRLDASGKLVTPGLIDLHTHLGFELHTHVVDPNAICPQTGVTTAVDQGSVGAFTFPWYRERVLSRTLCRLYSFINIASIGTIAIHKPYYVDWYGAYIDKADTIKMIEENRQHIRGIKAFATSAMTGEWALGAVKAAREVGRAVVLPVAVHISKTPPSLEAVLAELEPGDIITHSYTPHDQGILDTDGRIRPAVREARERGVLFDLGHGAGSFGFEVARKALAQGFPPDTISTDLYYSNIDNRVFDLPTTMSKFLALGMPLEQVVARVTLHAARALRDERLGSLAPGKQADVAVLSLREGTFELVDSRQETITTEHKLFAEATVMGGKVVWERPVGAR
jgi:dihydroorotase